MPRIPLPPFHAEPGASGHPFPHQIACQAHEFIQAALFYAAFMDAAVGEMESRAGEFKAVEKRMGLSVGEARREWALVQKYRANFGSVVFQSVIITLCSHWDWYVRKLSGFMLTSAMSVGPASMNKETRETLKKPDRKTIRTQLDTICNVLGASLQLDNSDVDALDEMWRVRNLGLHNRWEVDRKYQARAGNRSPALGELRVVDISELSHWRAVLTKVIRLTANGCSKFFHGAPAYVPELSSEPVSDD